MAHGLLSVLRRLEPRSVTYLVQFPGWGRLADLCRSRVPGRLIFDCMDDHAGFSNNATEVVKDETRLMEKADLVVTSSAKLYEKAATFNESTILVRNGTDFDMFHTLFPNGKLDSMKKPIIGYHGAISEWFDPQVVTEMRGEAPGMELRAHRFHARLRCQRTETAAERAAAGRDALQGPARLPVLLRRVHHPLPSLPLTMATNPVKFYEYISSGKPVVSVRLPEMEQYAEVCYLYEADEEFEKGIVTALNEKDEEPWWPSASRSPGTVPGTSVSWSLRPPEGDGYVRPERKRKVLKSTALIRGGLS